MSKAVDRVTARALRLKPGEVFLSVVWALCAGLGWLVNWVLWMPAAFLISSAVDGWQQAKQQQERLKVQASERENR